MGVKKVVKRTMKNVSNYGRMKKLRKYGKQIPSATRFKRPTA